MKKFLYFILLCLFAVNAFAQAPYTILEYSGTPADTQCVVFDGTEDEWEPGNCNPGGGGDITAVGDCSTGACFINSTDSNELTFEGSTADGNETLLTSIDPTADRTVSLPNLDGTILVEASIDTSAELAAIVTDETGSGALCFATSPTIGTPILTLDTTAPIASGQIAYNATDDRIQVFDGVGVDEYFVGPHTTAGTEYTVDDVAPATPTGPTNLIERDDALSTVTPIEGDWLHFLGSAEGALWTQDFNSDAILADTTSIIAGQLADGHNVTVDNASGASAVNVQDGGNSLTVDGTVAVTQATASNLNAQVVGNIAHDGVDSGNPVKTGTQATDYEPDTVGEQGRAVVAAADRADFAANLRGELIPAVKSEYNVLTALNDTYDDEVVTNVSANIDCWQYRYATVGFDLTKANTPTDLEFDIEVSLDGTNYQKLTNGGLAKWLYDDQTVGSGGIERAFGFPIGCQKVRVRVTATGTTSSATFTVANATIYFRT